MSVWPPPTVVDAPDERLRSWAVFEVLVPALGERSLRIAGDIANKSGRVSSPLVAIADANRSVVTRSGRAYHLVGRPGLALEGEYVWRIWRNTQENETPEPSNSGV